MKKESKKLIQYLESCLDKIKCFDTFMYKVIDRKRSSILMIVKRKTFFYSSIL